MLCKAAFKWPFYPRKVAASNLEAPWPSGKDGPRGKSKRQVCCRDPKVTGREQNDKRVKEVSVGNYGEIKFCLNVKALFTHTEKSNE